MSSVYLFNWKVQLPKTKVKIFIYGEIYNNNKRLSKKREK